MTTVLGRGTTSDVFECSVNNHRVAVKVFKPKYSRSAQLELSMMRRFEHPNIRQPAPEAAQAAAKSMFSTGIIVLDLCTPVTEKAAAKVCLAKWLVELSGAVAYLHERGIMHCDLKPDNVFIKGDTLQLGDLGLASTSPCDSDYCQSPPYAPPEASVNGRFVTFSADVWAFAVTAIEMVSNKHVFMSGSRGPDLEHQNSEPIRDMQGFLDRIAAPPFIKTVASLALREAGERPMMAELASLLGTIVHHIGGETNVFVS